QVKWNFNTKDANSIEIEFDDENVLTNQTDENEFNWSKVINKNEAYAIKPSNQFISNKEAIRYYISAVPDQYPSIDVDGQVDSILLTKIYFGGIIKDDYGFAELKLNYSINSEEHGDSAPEFRSETVFINKNVSEQKFHHLWDLSVLDLHTDEEVYYYFEVWDNDGVNGSKATRSATKTFKLPDFRQLAQETSSKNQKIKAMLKKSIKDAAELKAELDKLNKEALNKKNLDWSDKKKIEDLVKMHKELTKNMNEIHKENNKNAYKQSEFMELSEATMEMQKEVDKLFEEIMSDEMKKKFKELEDLLTEMDKKKIQDAIEDLEFDSEQYENELERMLEIFKMMEFKLKFDEVINRAEELARKEHEQAEETLDQKKDQEEKKSDQEKLNEEFSELKKEMKELEKMNRDLDLPAGMEQMDENISGIEKEMQESSSELEQNKNNDASGSQEDASKKLYEMAQKMENMKKEMEAGEIALNVEKLQEILENLITVSFDQEDLMKDVKETKRNDPRFLTHIQDQFKIRENAELIEDSLIEMAKKLPEVPQVLIREMASVNENIDKSIQELLDNRISDAAYRQQLVMTSVNNIALMLDEAKDKLNQQMAKSKGEGDCDKPSAKSCNKPGSCSKPGHGNKKKPGKGKNGMGNMKMLQEQLNERLKKARDGKMNSKELVQLAAKQEAIRRALQAMQHKLTKDKEKKGGGGKGDLKKIQELMEQTEIDIVNRTISQQTMYRQQEILTRLLEAEKAEKEREWDKRRESKEAWDLDELVSPPDFSKYYDVKKREIELLKTIPPSLNKFYKNKVSDYFNGLEIN
ncbi:MAG: hypothetical protein IH948_04120, partial [Bacteroidetes bacterium]|nr:hypothetical protein [Bacteroidota bacterium]